MPKNLYHGALKEMGAVRVTVKAERRASKYPGKPDYVHLLIDGQEYYYSTENEACATWFDGQKGQTFTLLAEGSREDATLSYMGEEKKGAPRQQRNTAKPPPRGQSSSPPAQQQRGNHPPPPQKMDAKSALGHLKVYVARNLTVVKVGLRAVRSIMPDYKTYIGIDMTDAIMLDLIKCVIFGSNNTKWYDSLPPDMSLETGEVVHREQKKQLLKGKGSKDAPPPSSEPPPEEEEDNEPLSAAPKCADCGKVLVDNSCPDPDCVSNNVPF